MPAPPLARSAPVLDGAAPELLARLADRAHRVRLPAGSALFEAGDPSDALYLVEAGSLEVVDAAEPDRVLRSLGRGAVVGELGVLTGAPRSATVVARRDSELLAVARDDVELLLRDSPALALAIARGLARQLAGDAAPAKPPPLRRVIALVGLDPAAPVDEIARLLDGELARDGPVAQLGEADAGELPAHAVERLLGAGKRVLLTARAHDAGPDWRAFCLREADGVLAIAGGGRIALSPRELARCAGCELLACGPAAARERLTSVAALVAPRRAQAVPAGPAAPDRIRALGRRLAGRSIGLVLSGGAARGLAQLGVLEELEAAGVTIDRVGGASQGAVIAAMVAKGRGAAHVVELCEHIYLGRGPTSDWTIPTTSLIRGRRTEDGAVYLAEGRETLIEEFPLALFLVSSDLLSGELVVHRRGSVVDAICASVAIPGVFAPRRVDGRLLVDGGMRNNLPVDVMTADHEGPVIAVDVTKAARRRSGPPRVPRAADSLMRSIGFASVDRNGAGRRLADLVIAPDVGGVGFLEWNKLQRAREAGREAARAVLETPPPWLTGS